MSKPLTNVEFKHRVYAKYHGLYKFLEPYSGRFNKLLCLHKLCGSVFKISPANFYSEKIACPFCQTHHHTFHIINGKIDPLVRVRCPKMHRFRIFQSEVPAFKAGKIRCPICQRLKVLDPLYYHAHVEFDFEFKDGHIL